MRGVLIVNPRATTTSPRVIDVIVQALSMAVDLDVVITSHRGHAITIGRDATARELDVVITLGGDGVVNEAVNGMLREADGGPVPILATVPGGSANVFARSLGIPNDTVEATGLILDRLRSGSTRTVGLGKADDRWFLANAGLGIDADIIAAMERQRRFGHSATPLRYLTTTISEYFRSTDRRHPALRIDRPGVGSTDGIFMTVVQNCSPWTYLGSRPLNPNPRASFDSGLDVFALRSLSLLTTFHAAQRIVTSTGGESNGAIIEWHDLPEFTISATRPVSLQIDGESMGSVTQVTLTSCPKALRVAC